MCVCELLTPLASVRHCGDWQRPHTHTRTHTDTHRKKEDTEEQKETETEGMTQRPLADVVPTADTDALTAATQPPDSNSSTRTSHRGGENTAISKVFSPEKGTVALD